MYLLSSSPYIDCDWTYWNEFNANKLLKVKFHPCENIIVCSTGILYLSVPNVCAPWMLGNLVSYQTKAQGPTPIGYLKRTRILFIFLICLLFVILACADESHNTKAELHRNLSTQQGFTTLFQKRISFKLFQEGRKRKFAEIFI